MEARQLKYCSFRRNVGEEIWHITELRPGLLHRRDIEALQHWCVHYTEAVWRPCEYYQGCRSRPGCRFATNTDWKISVLSSPCEARMRSEYFPTFQCTKRVNLMIPLLKFERLKNWSYTYIDHKTCKKFHLKIVSCINAHKHIVISIAW